MKTTLANWERPYLVNLFIEDEEDGVEYDLVKLLRDTGMAMTAADAKRIIETSVWIDRYDRAGTIYDRLERLSERRVRVKPEMTICVGSKLDVAVCHRIRFNYIITIILSAGVKVGEL